MKKYDISYEGQLRTIATHLKSKDTITTDAPTDNNGKGEAFSPTDLTAVSLATCILTVIGIKAKQMELEELEMTAEANKAMAAEPRRIQEISILVKIKDRNYSQKTKTILEQTGTHCPVAKSLHPDLVQDVQYVYY